MLSETEIKRISEAEMLNFGSGPSAYAFDYEAAHVNGVNLAMTPSAFGMEIAFLKEYASAFPKDAAAIFAVCPFSFGENQSNKNPLRYAKYYAVLSRQTINSLPFPLPHWDHHAAEQINLHDPLFPYGEDINRDEIPDDELMNERIESMCQCWKSELQLSNFVDASQAEFHRASFAREKIAMSAALETARGVGLRPFLLLPPLHSQLRQLFSKELYDEFVTRQITDAGVPVLDYTNDPAITDEMFLGPVFLNRKGAAYLTGSIWQIVRKGK